MKLPSMTGTNNPSPAGGVATPGTDAVALKLPIAATSSERRHAIRSGAVEQFICVIKYSKMGSVCSAVRLGGQYADSTMAPAKSPSLRPP